MKKKLKAYPQTQASLDQAGQSRREALFSQRLEEAADGFDSIVEVRDMELLVRSEQVVVGQAKAHHHYDAGNFQDVLEVGNDRIGTAAADEDRRFLERVGQEHRSPL